MRDLLYLLCLHHEEVAAGSLALDRSYPARSHHAHVVSYPHGEWVPCWQAACHWIQAESRTVMLHHPFRFFDAYPPPCLQERPMRTYHEAVIMSKRGAVGASRGKARITLVYRMQ